MKNEQKFRFTQISSILVHTVHQNHSQITSYIIRGDFFPPAPGEQFGIHEERLSMFDEFRLYKVDGAKPELRCKKC